MAKELLGQTAWVESWLWPWAVWLSCFLPEMEIVIVPTSEVVLRIKQVNIYKELNIVPGTL